MSWQAFQLEITESSYEKLSKILLSRTALLGTVSLGAMLAASSVASAAELNYHSLQSGWKRDIPRKLCVGRGWEGSDFVLMRNLAS